jgi:hypothetical protein
LHRAIREIDPAQGGGPNDGLVTVTSSLFGNPTAAYPELVVHRRPKWKTLGVVQADHIAEVGIPLWFQPSETHDHLAFFAGLAQFLDDAYTAKMTLSRDGGWERTPKSRPMPVSVAAVGPS